ncbi:unnamed protein product [Trichobilharzia regenti]|nr:unnamed protein product [Trichobilharzia regenti]
MSVSNSDCFQSIPNKSRTSCDILFWRGHIYESTDVNLSRDVGHFLDELSSNKSVDNVIQLIGSLSGSFSLIFIDVCLGKILVYLSKLRRLNMEESTSQETDLAAILLSLKGFWEQKRINSTLALFQVMLFSVLPLCLKLP